MIETTYPYVASPEVARHQCTECGKWERSDKGNIAHSKNCETKLQGNTAPSEQTPAQAATFAAGRNLTPAERRAIRSGAIAQVLSDDEIAEAVKFGKISIGDAMNRDS